MDILQAIFIGLVQGLTEFLPVSSSAHLIFVQQFMGLSVDQANLDFDTLLHLGTLLAVVSYFFKDIVEMIKAFFSSILDIFNGRFKQGYQSNQYKKLVWLVLIGSIPAGIIGILFKDVFEGLFQSVTIPALFLLITGILLFVSQRVNVGSKHINQMGVKDTILIGVGQAIAILPGISRSGATISSGLLLGLDKEFAAKFSFILAIPAIMGATLIQIKDIGAGLDANMMPYIAGFLVALISGYLAISLLLKLVKEKSLDIFAYYCWIMGGIILIYSFLL